MRNGKHIILFFVILTSISGFYACGGASMEEAAYKEEAIADSVYNTSEVNSPNATDFFEADTLTSQQLITFQLRGKQKLQDFIDYVEIICNKSYDSLLRKEAKIQILDLFSDTTTTVNIKLQEGKGVSSPLTITTFLHNLYTLKCDSIKVTTDSVITLLPAKIAARMEYSGVITAKVRIKVYENGEITFTSFTLGEAQTLIRKEQKEFGNEIKDVWSVTIKSIQ